MLNPDSSLARLLDAPMRPGAVTWIGVRPARREPMRPLLTAALEPGAGLSGDRYRGRGRTREVTLIAAEDLAAIAVYLGREAVPPDLLRRNIVLRGINLVALKERRVRLGTAVLEITGECHPCSRMEEVLGPGGYNAVRGRGGLTARVIASGVVSVGDALVREEMIPR